MRTYGGRLKLVLKGHVPAKKNLWKRGRGGRVYLNREAQDQIDYLTLQAQQKWSGKQPLTHPNFTVQFYARDQRGDRDNKFSTVLDLLQKAGVLVNDNIKQCNGTMTLLPAVVDKNERTVIDIAD